MSDKGIVDASQACFCI